MTFLSRKMQRIAARALQQAISDATVTVPAKLLASLNAAMEDSAAKADRWRAQAEALDQKNQELMARTRLTDPELFEQARQAVSTANTSLKFYHEAQAALEEERAAHAQTRYHLRCRSSEYNDMAPKYHAALQGARETVPYTGLRSIISPLVAPWMSWRALVPLDFPLPEGWLEGTMENYEKWLSSGYLPAKKRDSWVANPRTDVTRNAPPTAQEAEAEQQVLLDEAHAKQDAAALLSQEAAWLFAEAASKRKLNQPESPDGHR